LKIVAVLQSYLPQKYVFFLKQLWLVVLTIIVSEYFRKVQARVHNFRLSYFKNTCRK